MECQVSVTMLLLSYYQHKTLQLTVNVALKWLWSLQIWMWCFMIGFWTPVIQWSGVGGIFQKQKKSLSLPRASVLMDRSCRQSDGRGCRRRIHSHWAPVAAEGVWGLDSDRHSTIQKWVRAGERTAFNTDNECRTRDVSMKTKSYANPFIPSTFRRLNDVDSSTWRLAVLIYIFILCCTFSSSCSVWLVSCTELVLLFWPDDCS